MTETAPAPTRSEKAQRLRLLFGRGPEAAEIGHLDMARCWERAFREAGIAVSYSQGSRPQARISLAAGLAASVTSDGELLDVVLAERTPPREIVDRLTPHLPPGVTAAEAWEVGMGTPSLPATMRWADYDVQIDGVTGDAAANVITSFLARESFPWEDTRGEKVRHYDLRAMIRELRVAASDGRCVRLAMRLRCDAGGVGRPEQVVKALGLPVPQRVHRRRLILAESSPAHEAWRRRGRYIG